MKFVRLAILGNIRALFGNWSKSLNTPLGFMILAGDLSPGFEFA